MHKLKTSVLAAGICLLSLAVGTPTMAADGAAVYQATCLACHGPDAKTSIMPLYPKLAGQNEEYLLNQLKAFKGAKRMSGQGAIMMGVLGPLSEEDMAAVAKWISEQPGF
jgi:cytochrome c